MKSVLLSTLIASPLLLTACATTGSHSTKVSIDCQAPNWQQAGISDGKNGRYPYEISRYSKQCPSLTISTEDRAAWESGRQEGLKTYCTKAYAYELGQRGYSMNQVCPEEGLLEIQQSHALGYQHYYQRERLYDDWWRPYPPFGSFGWYGPRSRYWW